MSDCNSIRSLWKFASNTFVNWKWSCKCTKKVIFFQIMTPILRFLYQNRKHGCISFTVHRTAFSVSKCMRLLAITSTCHSLISITVIIWNIAQIRWFSPWSACLTHLNEWSNPPKMLNLWAILNLHILNLHILSQIFILFVLRTWCHFIMFFFSILPWLSCLPSE